MDFTQLFKDYLKDGKTVEEALMVLREQGASMGKSVMAVKTVLDLEFSNADKLVVNSVTWIDLKEQTTQLRQVVFENMDELNLLNKTISIEELDAVEKEMLRKG